MMPVRHDRAMLKAIGALKAARNATNATPLPKKWAMLRREWRPWCRLERLREARRKAR